MSKTTRIIAKTRFAGVARHAKANIETPTIIIEGITLWTIVPMCFASLHKVSLHCFCHDNKIPNPDINETLVQMNIRSCKKRQDYVHISSSSPTIFFR